ncbi:hypothetical protein [Romboutsia sp.]|nr:hypothetical protein [Romboutsia sp.]HSQ89304.1 hypothetical protein [Romboutsia sp.]
MDLRKHWIHGIYLRISMLHFKLGAYNEGCKGSWHYKNGENIFY